jgi:SH3-like domain-containing protein
VSGKRVTRLAAETRATWHSGNRRGNGTTIGIEVHPRHTETTWDTLVELCADIEERHGSLSYYRHSDWKATACPGVYRTMISRLVNDVNAEHRRRKSGGSTRPASSGSSSSASSSSSGDYRVKRTNRDNVPIHSHRDSSGDRQIDTLFTAGYRVNVVEESGSWTRIRNSKGPGGNGWVASVHLNPFYEDQRTSNGTAIVDFLSRTTEDKVPVFAGTGRNAKRIGWMHNTGYRVRVTGMKGTTGSWARIRWDGGHGWVHADKLERP